MTGYPSSRCTARRRLAWLRRSAVAGTLTLAMLRGAPVAEAQAPFAVGPEFQVNTYTTGNQRFSAVAMDADGDFVIVWESTGQDGDGRGIYAQRYGTDGAMRGSEFRVNTQTMGGQGSPSVAMNADGDFVVAWDSYGQDGSSSGIYARAYDAEGAERIVEFGVNDYTTGNQRSPSVGLDAEGGFVIVWESFNQDGGERGIYAKRYGPDGVARGEEFRVNTYTTGPQSEPSVAVDADGDFVVVWESYLQDGDGSGIYGQRYGADGATRDGEFRVNTYTTNSQLLPSVAMDADGDFVVTWTGSHPDDSSYGIRAQRYTADATPQGDEFRVNIYTTGSQGVSLAGMDADGDFVITWQSSDQDGHGYGIYARRYAADGTTENTELQINTYTTDDQIFPAVGVNNDGDFVVTWVSGSFTGSGQDGDRYGVFAQRFLASPVAAEDDATLPTALALDAVFPNPVRDVATLRYALPSTATVRLSVTDVLGRTVLTRAEGVQPAGPHEAQLALDGLPSGVYVVRLDAEGAVATQQLTVVR